MSWKWCKERKIDDMIRHATIIKAFRFQHADIDKMVITQREGKGREGMTYHKV